MKRFLLATLVASLAACSRDPAAASRRYIESGDRYAREGKYTEAAIQYPNAIKKMPESVEAHRRLADVAARAQDPATAVGEVLRIAELEPDDVGAQVRAGAVFLLAGRFDAARDRAEKALRVDAADPRAHILLGQVLAALHDPQKSEASFREAVRLAPQSADAHVALGSYLWSSNRANDAETELRRAIDLAPLNVPANRALALFFMAAGRAPEAEPLWKTVSAGPEGDPFVLADFHASQGRLREAEGELSALLSRPALVVAARLRLSGVLYARGDRAGAHQMLDAVLAHDGHNLPALLLRSRFLVADGKLDEAL